MPDIHAMLERAIRDASQPPVASSEDLPEAPGRPEQPEVLEEREPDTEGPGEAGGNEDDLVEFDTDTSDDSLQPDAIQPPVDTDAPTTDHAPQIDTNEPTSTTVQPPTGLPGPPPLDSFASPDDAFAPDLVDHVEEVETGVEAEGVQDSLETPSVGDLLPDVNSSTETDAAPDYTQPIDTGDLEEMFDPPPELATEDPQPDIPPESFGSDLDDSDLLLPDAPEPEEMQFDEAPSSSQPGEVESLTIRDVSDSGAVDVSLDAITQQGSDRSGAGSSGSPTAIAEEIMQRIEPMFAELSERIAIQVMQAVERLMDAIEHAQPSPIEESEFERSQQLKQSL